MLKIKNYTLDKDEKGRYWLSDGNRSGLLIFYYTPEETLEHHQNNIFHGYSFMNEAKGLYKQLIGWDWNISNKQVYNKIIIEYVKGDYNERIN